MVGEKLEIVPVEIGKTNKTPEYLAQFPFGKAPAMETPAGPIYESNAIAYYLAQRKPELLGTNDYERALVVQFMCSLDCELYPTVMKVVYPIVGYGVYDAAEWKAAHEQLLAKLKIYDSILAPRTYLVGEAVTLADIILAASLERVYALVLDASARKNLVNLTRWYVTIANQPAFKAVNGEVILCEKAADPSKVAPKTAAAPKAAAPKAEAPKAAAAAVAANDEEDEPAPKPKEKNPLDLLPPSKFNLEEWKRFYSNCKETKPVATNWFWEHFDPEGFSIWRGDYKYNDELKMIFMTCNLVTGLFSRMEALRRYCFASVLIFGEDNNNEVSGYFVFRGKDMPEMMKEVPDYDCYNWTRMDITDKKQVELFEDYLAWDGQLEGKSFNQGKIFK